MVLSNVAYEKSNTNIFNAAFAKRTTSTHNTPIAVKMPAKPPGDIGHLLEEAALGKKFKKKRRSVLPRRRSPIVPK